MAKDNKALSDASKRMQDISKGIADNMDSIYRSTYMTNPQQNKDLADLTDSINSSIDRIVNRNISTHGLPSVTNLYSRIAAANKQGGKDLMHDLESMFDNGLMTDDLYALFMSNRYLRDLDAEIDTVCKYMPDLEEALAVQRDCVLSADHFSKDFLMIKAPNSGVEPAVFTEKIKELKRKYDLAELVESIYDDTSKYGEKFIYRVPFATAIGRLLATKPDSTIIPHRSLSESVEEYEDTPLTETFLLSMNNDNMKIVTESSTILSESVRGIPDGKDVTKRVPSVLGKGEQFNIGIQICRSGIVESAIEDHKNAFDKKAKFTPRSMASVYEQSYNETHINEASGDKKNIEAKGNIEFGASARDKRILANDGLVAGRKPEPVKVKAPGCVVKKLPRESVIPIYIDDICMGYYYFEVRSVDTNENFMGFKNIMGDPLTNVRSSGDDGRGAFNSVDVARQDDTIKYVAGQLSKFIDKQFVNSNQDIAKEIYMILKYNDLFNTPSIDMIKVTFIPPEDMVHFFFKQDPITHRGISDLAKGLIPAKIYTSLYITSSIGNLTRGYDKRVYYVKQTVDTNIAQTLLNTISQIKQSNFGIRQFQNINNILNITGRFNDMVIPTNASGDPPIQFEIMPGQDIQTPTELMEQLKDMAINSTGIPIEIIQARKSIDYAMQLTMSSSKVLRFCYKRQELFEDDLVKLIGPIYNYEFDDNAIIDIELPPPTFINVTNTNQLVDNIKGFAQSLADIELAGNQDQELLAKYTNSLFKFYIGSHIDVSRHEDILNRCKMQLERDRNEAHSDNAGSGNDDDYGAY